jgi:hypothetical protein
VVVTEEPVRMPDFVRKALLAQGLYDPEEIEEKAQKVDLSAPDEPEQLALVEP